MKFTDPKKLSAAELEEGDRFAPRFGDDGLITALALDAETGEVLMLAHMNREALEKTLQTGEAHYYSRSRQSLWKKGESSGEVQQLVEMRVDCDQDAIIVVVRPQGHGAACHTGRKSCFFRTVRVEEDIARLEVSGGAPLFDPHDVYGGKS